MHKRIYIIYESAKEIYPYTICLIRRSNVRCFYVRCCGMWTYTETFWGLTAVLLKVQVIWVVILCRWVLVHDVSNVRSALVFRGQPSIEYFLSDSLTLETKGLRTFETSGSRTLTTNRAVPENLNLRHAIPLLCTFPLQKLVLLQVVKKYPASLESE